MSRMDLYLVDKGPYQQGMPSASQNLISVYGLDDLAASVARSDPVTGAKRKLRKSYKNHIADLAGRHVVPEPGENSWSLADAARRPIPGGSIEPLSKELIDQVQFEKSPQVGIPGFDVKLLATYGQSDEAFVAGQSPAANSPGKAPAKKRRDQRGPTPGEKRRRVN